MTKKEKDAKRADALKYLREWIKAGDTIYTILTHVSSSGMSRRIKVVMIDTRNGNTQPDDISATIADALGLKWNGEGSIVIGGVGMDMGYYIVYSLGRLLWPTIEEASAQKHKTGRNGFTGYETDGGYLLNHSWL